MRAFEFLDNLDNRNRIRFMEIFEDYTVQKYDLKDYAMIQKREFNPELSAFSNVVLDLIDFRDRVKPLARDLTLMDVSRKYQRTSLNEIERQKQEILDEMRKGSAEQKGYSSGELTEGRSATVDAQKNQEETSEERKKEE